MKILLSIILTTLFIFPNNTDLNKEIESLDLLSSNYILYSVDSEKVLAYENHQDKIAPASILKVLTTITAIELLGDTDLDTIITVDPIVFETLDPLASLARLYPNQEVSIREVLYGVLLSSGADATGLISIHLTGTYDGLVEEMNKKAQKIGMVHTQVKNTSGLDMIGQYTTLEDLTLLINYAVKNDVFMEMYSKVEHTYESNPYVTIDNYILKDTEEMGYDAIIGAKSGYTTIAQFALSSFARKNNTEYIFISTNAPGHIYDERNGGLDDAIKVYDYMYENFDKVLAYDENVVKKDINIKRRFSDYPYIHKDKIDVLIDGEMDISKIRHEYILDETLKAPIKKDTVLGKHHIYYDDALVFETDILSDEDITIGFVYPAFFVLFIIALLVVLFLYIKRRIKLYKNRRYYY